MFRGKKEVKKDLNFRIVFRLRGVPETQYDAIMNAWAQTLKNFEDKLGQLYDARTIDFDLMKQISKGFELEKYGATKIKNVELSAVFSSGAGDLFAPSSQSASPSPGVPQPAPTPSPRREKKGRRSRTPAPEPTETDPFDFEAIMAEESSKPALEEAQSELDGLFPSSTTEKPPVPTSNTSSIPAPTESTSSSSPPMPPINFGPLNSSSNSEASSKSSPPEFPTPTPSDSPRTPSLPSITLPSIGKEPSIPAPQAASGDEEDRATGIAVLRKQMLTELKKIRSIIDSNE
ncbi:MAG: hypothetical protein ACFFC7_21000 [Candidatus Hermodarchaeota archaeon]